MRPSSTCLRRPVRNFFAVRLDGLRFDRLCDAELRNSLRRSMVWRPPSNQVTDVAFSIACLNAWAVPMSGSGAPRFTATPMPDDMMSDGCRQEACPI